MKINRQKEKPQGTITIERLSAEGRGVGYFNDKITFVHNALPGETVICKMTKQHSRYNEAEVIEILTPSPKRIKPLCHHFEICGGCSLQHMSTDTQLEFKEKEFIEQLNRLGQVFPEKIIPALSGPEWHYRRKARLGVKYVRKKERLLVGFREKSSHYLTEIEECPVLHETVGKKIKDLRNFISTLSQYDHIAQIEVAVSDEDTALVFRNLTTLSEEDIQKLIEFGKQHDFHIYLQPNSPHSLQKIWPENPSHSMSYSLPDHKLKMFFHPLDFVQINKDINKAMLNQAIQLLDPKDNEDILDLFCGLGNFTLPIARLAKHVTGVEGGEEMVQRATRNAELNHINNAEFYAANLMNLTNDAPWTQKKYHKILLDPPRSGAQEIIQFFPNFSASRIIYISCNPATLARDAKILVHEQNYKLKIAGIINMFPHTSHTEAIAMFEK